MDYKIANSAHSSMVLVGGTEARVDVAASAPKCLDKTPVALLKNMCSNPDFGVLSRLVQKRGIVLIRLVP
jgi:hypothetical protein